VNLSFKLPFKKQHFERLLLIFLPVHCSPVKG